MAITDVHIDAMRSMLVGDFDSHWRLADQIDTSSWADYNALLVAAFFTAVERRFDRNTSESEIIQFVAKARARFDDDGAGIDPTVAERLVLAALGRIDLDGSDDDDMVIRVETALLTVLISDEGLDDPGLAAFLQDARKLAGEWAEES